jgi:hypothetical protein
MIHFKGEVQFHKIQTEMEHLKRATKMQHVRDDVCSNKGSPIISHQNVQSLRNKKDNLKILLDYCVHNRRTWFHRTLVI